jgi:hypothetical protein
MNCTNCNEPINPKRLKLVPETKYCTECLSTSDVFKWRMKTVGFFAEPTIAKTSKEWDSLKKQKKVQDI